MDTHINPRPVVSCYRPIKTVNINQLVPDLYDRITVDQVFGKATFNSPATFFLFSLDSYLLFLSSLLDLIRDIRDPEHPYSLEELNVVRENLIIVNDNLKDCIIRIEFTPTVPHCSLATLIGLCIRVQLNRNLPKYAKVRFRY